MITPGTQISLATRATPESRNVCQSPATWPLTECVPEPHNLAVDRSRRGRYSRHTNAVFAPVHYRPHARTPYADLPASVDVEDACRWLPESRPWSSAADRVIVAAPVGGHRGQTVNRTVRRGGPSPVESGPDNAGRPVRYGSGSRGVDTATAAVVRPPWWIGAGAFASNR